MNRRKMEETGVGGGVPGIIKRPESKPQWGRGDTQRGIAQRVRREFASQRRSLHVCQSRRHQPRPVSSLEIDQRTLCRYSKLVSVGQTDRRQTDSLEPLDSPSPTGLQAPSVPLTGTVRAFRDLLRGDFLFPRETERQRERAVTSHDTLSLLLLSTLFWPCPRISQSSTLLRRLRASLSFPASTVYSLLRTPRSSGRPSRSSLFSLLVVSIVSLVSCLFSSLLFFCLSSLLSSRSYRTLHATLLGTAASPALARLYPFVWHPLQLLGSFSVSSRSPHNTRYNNYRSPPKKIPPYQPPPAPHYPHKAPTPPPPPPPSPPHRQLS